MSNQILWDCHMHSSFSADSDTSMEDMILEAIRRGLHGICFTEHLDPDYPPTPDNETFELDLAGYQNTLYALRDKYRSELEIHYGIELGLQPHLEASFRELLETVPFDFVIGSSHVVHGYDPYYKEFFKNRSRAISAHRDVWKDARSRWHHRLLQGFRQPVSGKKLSVRQSLWFQL